VVCSLMGHCCLPNYGQHLPLAATQPAPPETLQTPPAGAQQAHAAAAPQGLPTGMGYHRVPTA
jgi:hypothetical protein